MIEAHLARLPDRGLTKDGVEVTTLVGERVCLENLDQAKPCGNHMAVPVGRLLQSATPTQRPARQTK